MRYEASWVELQSKFYWFTKAFLPATSTDESGKDERVPSLSSTTSATSSYLERYSPLTDPIFFHRDDRKEIELLPAEINQRFGFLTNRLEGYGVIVKVVQLVFGDEEKDRCTYNQY
jgi:hypothetical protein